MPRKNLPAWQQVVLTALDSMYGVKNGHEAWDKLKDEEKTAVMDFLAEHCGGDAPSSLADTCAIAKPSGLPKGLENFLGFVGAVAIYFVVKWISDWFSSIDYLEPLAWLWLLLMFGLYSLSIFSDDRPSRMRELWRNRERCDVGPRAVLDEMYRVRQMSLWQAMDKGMLVLRLILFGVLLAVCILNWHVFFT